MAPLDTLWVTSVRATQDVVDATLVLKGKLASAGGLKAFKARTGHSPGLALHAIDPAISKVAPSPVPDLSN